MALGQGAPEKVEIEVIENPQPAPPNLNLAEPPKPLPPEEKRPTEPARKVFGVSKKAITSDEPGAGVDLKQGNTVATAPDNEKLKDSDAESLPIPTDEYLVERMPSVLSEVRVPYPVAAKEKNIEGPVVLEILIDGEGRVREVKLVKGLGYGLDEAALAALKLFKFKPAIAGGKAVAVRTQFTYRFVLEK